MNDSHLHKKVSYPKLEIKTIIQFYISVIYN